MREMNHSYLHDTDYVVGGRMVKGGLQVSEKGNMGCLVQLLFLSNKHSFLTSYDVRTCNIQTIPYNEIYIRVGGPGRISNGIDVSTDDQCIDTNGTGRSFDDGIGLPVALFVREADYGHLVSLLRTRARFSSIFGRKMAKGIPLLYITPEDGVRVFTEHLQSQVLKTMAWDLNPFQNPSISHKTSVDNTSEPHLQQKLEELLDLEDDSMKQNLTPEEMARIAGGFGATDSSVAQLLHDAMQRDLMTDKGADSPGDAAHSLQGEKYSRNR